MGTPRGDVTFGCLVFILIILIMFFIWAFQGGM